MRLYYVIFNVMKLYIQIQRRISNNIFAMQLFVMTKPRFMPWVDTLSFFFPPRLGNSTPSTPRRNHQFPSSRIIVENWDMLDVPRKIVR